MTGVVSGYRSVERKGGCVRAKYRKRWERYRRNAEGCVGWLLTCMMSLLLLAINVVVCRTIYERLEGIWWEERIQVKQAVLLVAPAILLFVQWWLWDLMGEWLAGRFRHKERRDERA